MAFFSLTNVGSDFTACVYIVLFPIIFLQYYELTVLPDEHYRDQVQFNIPVQSNIPGMQHYTALPVHVMKPLCASQTDASWM